jgi:uncharacterized membrane protein
MTDQNPYEPGLATNTDLEKSGVEDITSGQAAYNVVADTVTGLNVRKRDNLFQAMFIFVSILLLAALGAALAAIYGGEDFPWFGGALIGAFAGLVAGFFASGIFLMIYRAVRHIKGQHD